MALIGIAIPRPFTAATAETRSAAFDGVRAAAPLLVGLTPLGLVVGATIANSSVGPLPGLSTSWIIYGATAQLMAVRLLDGGATPLVVVASVLLVNLRISAYGAGMAPAWRTASRRWRLLASALLVEPSYAVGTAEPADADPDHGRVRYLGGALTFFIGWQILTVIGMSVGDGVTRVVSADVALGVALISMVIPAAMRSGAATGSALVGGAVGVATVGLPDGTGTLLAGACGVAAGWLIERRRP